MHLFLVANIVPGGAHDSFWWTVSRIVMPKGQSPFGAWFLWMIFLTRESSFSDFSSVSSAMQLRVKSVTGGKGSYLSITSAGQRSKYIAKQIFIVFAKDRFTGGLERV